VAANLPRPDDVEVVPALVGRPGDDPWAALRGFAERHPAAEFVERARLVGVPASALGEFSADPVTARATRLGAPGRPASPPLVVDLSAMWAGPLVAKVLGAAGARVVKVEHPARPDGARGGPPRFFDWLHAGHASAAWDFTSREGTARLLRLLRRADVVVESSRPRALAQLGIEPAPLVASRPGVTWVTITAYGRDPSTADRVGFGDDTAAAAGLVATDAEDRPVFCGDAIADPITGLLAALAAARSVAAGGGYLLELPLAAAAGWIVADGDPPPRVTVRAGSDGRDAVHDGDTVVAVAEPIPPPAGDRAEALGESTERVLAELAAR
jgi:CoA-transferase family III